MNLLFILFQQLRLNSNLIFIYDNLKDRFQLLKQKKLSFKLFSTMYLIYLSSKSEIILQTKGLYDVSHSQIFFFFFHKHSCMYFLRIILLP